MNATSIIQSQVNNPFPLIGVIIAIAVVGLLLFKGKQIIGMLRRKPQPIVKAEIVPERRSSIHRSRNFEYLQTILIISVIIIVFFAYTMMNNPYLTKDNPTDEEIKIGTEQRNTGFLVFFMFAVFFSIPIGLFIGWIFFDPYQRAKAKRFMLKKNYGIVNFVTKGNKIISKIKNFDHDLLWVDDGVWVLEPNRVFLQEKIDESQREEKSHPIRESDFQTLSGIPVLFLDIGTMRPLSFQKENGDANPIDLASTLKGWVMSQLAKNMFFKKTFTAMSLITIVLLIVSVYFTWENYTVLQDLKDIMPALQTLADRSGDIVKAGHTIIQQGAGG